MNLNNNLIARQMLNELPGLVGALQPAGGAPQSLSDMARRQHSQNLANAMLSAASGLLTPSPNRYPLGPLQRLGAGLGAALQSYDEGGQQGGILDALGMDGRVTPRRVSAVGAARPGRVAPRPRARIASAPVAAEALGAKVLGRSATLPSRALRKAASRQLKLEDFSGTVAQRLDHPAVLPGGWKLYGYEKEGGRPVYMGPGRKLRVYR
jgi:hypothetical protein